jgi:lysozyme family protein
MTDAAQDIFPRIFAIVVGHEGEALDLTREDRGNWTGGVVGRGELRGSKFGLSAASYPNVDIAALTLESACAIARRDFWEKMRGAALPPALALLVFDAAYNNGLSRAVRWLQAAVGVNADGVIGPATLAAVASRAGDGATLCAEFQAQRLAFMASLPTWPVFGLGWARRLCALPYQSLTLPQET